MKLLPQTEFYFCPPRTHVVFGLLSLLLWNVATPVVSLTAPDEGADSTWHHHHEWPFRITKLNDALLKYDENK
eukprot:8670825-Pyramimonas_sp.AAC.1